ncbi:CCA tRNA nucleotidyltransferase [Jeotgalibacillus salarius]|nr:CCA tRNA nucleotidyltransferase [Jeotgalibacillus salarius]
MNEIFQQALPVLKEIESHGFEAYFVGGCVRDYYLNRDINDIDIAVSATPEEIKKIFKQTIDVGIDHGTVLVIHETGHFEVTTFRTDGEYSDSRRPDQVSFVRSLKEDLKRRDFTMNAMALSSSFELTDLFNGRRDIKNREIRTVGSPLERFNEDALRMLRAIRFVSQLDFNIEKDTYHAISASSSALSNVAVERKAAEVEKLLIGQAMDRSLAYAVDTGLSNFMPPLINAEITRQLKGKKWIALNFHERMVLILIIGHFSSLRECLSKWRFSNKRIKLLMLIHELVMIRQQREFLKTDIYYIGKENVEAAEKVYAVLSNQPVNTDHISACYSSMKIKNKSDLAFKGTHLIKWTGLKGGPWVKACTNQIETLILSEELENEVSEIKKWVQTKWLQK